jgi:hypothetical protein
LHRRVIDESQHGQLEIAGRSAVAAASSRTVTMTRRPALSSQRSNSRSLSALEPTRDLSGGSRLCPSRANTGPSTTSTCSRPKIGPAAELICWLR